MRVRGLANPTAQGDAIFLDILARMGCEVIAGDEITVTGGDLRGGVFDCNSSPDIVPTLAAMLQTPANYPDRVTRGPPYDQSAFP